MNTEVILSVVAILFGGGGIGGYLRSRAVMKRADTDGVKVITGAAADLIRPLREEIATLRDQVTEQNSQLEAAAATTRQLRSDLADAQDSISALNIKLEAAHRKANYFEHEYQRVTMGGMG